MKLTLNERRPEAQGYQGGKYAGSVTFLVTNKGPAQVAVAQSGHGTSLYLTTDESVFITVSGAGYLNVKLLHAHEEAEVRIEYQGQGVSGSS